MGSIRLACTLHAQFAWHQYIAYCRRALRKIRRASPCLALALPALEHGALMRCPVEWLARRMENSSDIRTGVRGVTDPCEDAGEIEPSARQKRVHIGRW